MPPPLLLLPARWQAVEDELGELNRQLEGAKWRQNHVATALEGLEAKLARARQLLARLDGERTKWNASLDDAGEDRG